MSSSEIAVSVRGLGKSYTLNHQAHKHTTLGELVMHRLRHARVSGSRETFWALRDIAFDIKRGDVVGIIGRNGAGKSTLLKILSRITEPTTGQIDLYGRVGSLLEVGTGFHPELTGRENIFLNGAILGMTRKEITQQFDAIVDFSGTEKFLDTPVKRYSSGMYVRLAFAVAAHLNPEILIVDEVLAVGDAEFQKKCMGKMQDVAHGGRTVLFVSHNASAVNSLCSHCLYLKQGQIEAYGKTGDIMPQYFSAANASANLDLKSRTDRKGSGKMRSTGIRFLDEHKNEIQAVPTTRPFFIAVDYECYEDVKGISVSIDVETLQNTRVSTLFGGFKNEYFDVKKGTGTFACRITNMPLRPDRYSLNVHITSGFESLDLVENAAILNVEESIYASGYLPKKEHGELLSSFSWSLTTLREDFNALNALSKSA